MLQLSVAVAQLDRLTYDEVVRIPDPTGLKAKHYRAEYYGGPTSASVVPRTGTQPQNWGVNLNREAYPRGGSDLFGGQLR